MNNVDIRAIPQLKTKVAMHGASKQKEVGGVVCVGVLVGIIYMAG
jgi:hypothetical protein